MENSNLLKCSECWKPEALCLCSEIRALSSKTEVLILQHPQEARNPLTTARLTSLTLSNSTHRVGLNWRSLSAALGREANAQPWAVLFVGTLKGVKNLPNVPFQVVTQKGAPVPKKDIKGIVILDGNWKQSKTLWWRNPWLLKLKRIVLNPEQASQWDGLRKQPRKNCLSTIESVSFSLAELDGKNGAPDVLVQLFKKHVELAQLQRRGTRTPEPKQIPPIEVTN